MKKNDFEPLAGFVAEVILTNKSVKKEVVTCRQQFLEVQYCLPPDRPHPYTTYALAGTCLRSLRRLRY